jgi:hypothetical protein
MEWGILPSLASIVGGVLSTVAILTWWLSRQFSKQDEKFSTKIDSVLEKIMNKLEYHEKHDDERFAEIRNLSNQRFGEIKDEIWQIRLRNASKDGFIPNYKPDRLSARKEDKTNEPN